MDFLGILKGALGVIGDVTGIGILKQASAAIETIPPEKQAEIQVALLAHEAQMKQLGIDEMKIAISESLAMINSSDKFVSRARPFGVYAASIITAGLAIAMICSIKLDTGAIVYLLAPLWGSAAYYTFSRTKEKTAGANGG